jgi:hypothetical protein
MSTWIPLAAKPRRSWAGKGARWSTSEQTIRPSCARKKKTFAVFWFGSMPTRMTTPIRLSGS